MDIEKMMKMNSLTKELQNQGFATDSTDAYSLAENMVNGNAQEKEAEEGGLVQVEAPQIEAEPSIKVESKNDYLMEKRFDMMLTEAQKQFRTQQVYSNDLISALAKEVVDLKNQVSLLQQSKTVKKAVRKVVAEKEQKHFKKEFVEPHPKQGDTKQEDVDVNKIFYFGNK